MKTDAIEQNSKSAVSERQQSTVPEFIKNPPPYTHTLLERETEKMEETAIFQYSRIQVQTWVAKYHTIQVNYFADPHSQFSWIDHS